MLIAPLTLQKTHTKTNAFSTFSLFGPSRPAHICIKLAIQGLSDDFFTFRSSFFILFMKMCSPLKWRAQFCRSTQSIFNQNHHFSRRRNGSDRPCLGDGFCSYRSVVRSSLFLFAPCAPSWTSKTIGKVCISTTGGFLVAFLRTFIFQFSSMFVEYHMIFNRSSNFGGPSMDFFWICIRKSESLEASKPRSIEWPRRESRSEINFDMPNVSFEIFDAKSNY